MKENNTNLNEVGVSQSIKAFTNELKLTVNIIGLNFNFFQINMVSFGHFEDFDKLFILQLNLFLTLPVPKWQQNMLSFQTCECFNIICLVLIGVKVCLITNKLFYFV